MNLNIFSLIKEIFVPLERMVDEVHTSAEEKLQARNQLQALQNEMTFKLLELRKAELDAQSSIIIAEAKGESWLQRSWRPVTMLTFTALVVAHWLGWTAENLSEDTIQSLLEIVKYGISGYIVGRSAEKVADKVSTVMKGKDVKDSS